MNGTPVKRKFIYYLFIYILVIELRGGITLHSIGLDFCIRKLETKNHWQIRSEVDERAASFSRCLCLIFESRRSRVLPARLQRFAQRISSIASLERTDEPSPSSRRPHYLLIIIRYIRTMYFAVCIASRLISFLDCTYHYVMIGSIHLFSR